MTGQPNEWLVQIDPCFAPVIEHVFKAERHSDASNYGFLSTVVIKYFFKSFIYRRFEVT